MAKKISSMLGPQKPKTSKAKDAKANAVLSKTMKLKRGPKK